jgi:hypothetical protein
LPRHPPQLGNVQRDQECLVARDLRFIDICRRGSSSKGIGEQVAVGVRHCGDY